MSLLARGAKARHLPIRILNQFELPKVQASVNTWATPVIARECSKSEALASFMAVLLIHPNV